MIVEHRTIEIEVERRLSDYCKECSYFMPTVEVIEGVQDNGFKKKHIERCAYCNQCDSLYRRVMQNEEDKHRV